MKNKLLVALGLILLPNLSNAALAPCFEEAFDEVEAKVRIQANNGKYPAATKIVRGVLDYNMKKSDSDVARYEISYTVINENAEKPKLELVATLKYEVEMGIAKTSETGGNIACSVLQTQLDEKIERHYRP